MLKLNSNTLATCCEELTHWKRPQCWERLRAGGEGDNRGWDGWMAPPTQWTWVWVNSRIGDRQRSLACCSSRDHKESDMTEWLNWTDTVKSFGIVNKAETDVCLEISRFFDDPTDVGILISGFSAFSKSSLHIWKFMVHVLLKPGLENFEHYFTSVWDEYSCVVVWAFFGIAFLWYWNENWPFPVLWPLLNFPNLLAYWVQHFNSIIF